jgi:hypothetical protein
LQHINVLWPESTHLPVQGGVRLDRRSYGGRLFNYCAPIQCQLVCDGLQWGTSKALLSSRKQSRGTLRHAKLNSDLRS